MPRDTQCDVQGAEVETASSGSLFALLPTLVCSMDSYATTNYIHPEVIVEINLGVTNKAPYMREIYLDIHLVRPQCEYVNTLQ